MFTVSIKFIQHHAILHGSYLFQRAPFLETLAKQCLRNVQRAGENIFGDISFQ